MRIWIRFGLILGALAAISACVGLGGEPPIVSTRMPAPPPTLTPVRPSVIELGYPLTPPDLTQGASIYAQQCAGCHGDTGAGDGPVALNAGLMPGNFRDPASARSQTPHEWFSTITNGRIENLMPPWKDALSEQARWDVAMYTYTLHTAPDDLALGAMLYQECAECHGTLGKGDGPEALKAPKGVKDLTDQGAMVTLSDESMFKMVTQGFEEVMPSFADSFTESERWAVVAYARSLSLTASGAPAAQAEDVLDVSGTVTLFSTQAVPPGLSVSLRAFDAQTGQSVESGVMMPAPVAEDGTYRFEDVPRDPSVAYLAAVTYLGYPFGSAPMLAENAPTLTLDVVLYDITTALTDVTATAWVTQITAYDGQLEVITVIQVQNLSESLMFSTGEFLSDGRPIAFSLPIPDGATVLPPEVSGQVIAPDGRAMIDTQPLPPRGQKLLTARYTLPYTMGDPLSLPTDLTVGGVVRVLIRPSEMRVESDTLPPLGEEFIGGDFYKAYGDQIALKAGLSLDMVLSGQPLAVSAAPTPAPTPAVSAPTVGIPSSAAVTSDILTPILALMGLVVVGGTLVLLFRRPKQ